MRGALVLIVASIFPNYFIRCVFMLHSSNPESAGRFCILRSQRYDKQRKWQRVSGQITGAEGWFHPNGSLCAGLLTKCQKDFCRIWAPSGARGPVGRTTCRALRRPDEGRRNATRRLGHREASRLQVRHVVLGSATRRIRPPCSAFWAFRRAARIIAADYQRLTTPPESRICVPHCPRRRRTSFSGGWRVTKCKLRLGVGAVFYFLFANLPASSYLCTPIY